MAHTRRGILKDTGQGDEDPQDALSLQVIFRKRATNPQKSPIIGGSFAEKDLQLEASSRQNCYRVATISRILKIIGLFCKRGL